MANFMGHIRAFMGDVHEINDDTIVACLDRLWESTYLASDNSKFADIAMDVLTCLMDYKSLMQLARALGIRDSHSYRRPEQSITNWYISTNIV